MMRQHPTHGTGPYQHSPLLGCQALQQCRVDAGAAEGAAAAALQHSTPVPQVSGEGRQAEQHLESDAKVGTGWDGSVADARGNSQAHDSTGGTRGVLSSSRQPHARSTHLQHRVQVACVA